MTIATVRALVPDRAVYDRAEDTGDGGTLEYLLPNKPVVESSVSVYLDNALATLTTDYTVDLELGLLRFTQAPGLGVRIVMTYQHVLLSDATIQVYLDLEGDDRLAAADALDAIASSTALVEKVQRLGDFQTDGAAVADALRKHADTLRAESGRAGSTASGAVSGLRIRRLARPQLINGGTEYSQ